MATITITNAGLGLIRDALAGANNSLITYIALGTSSTAPAVTDTQLGAEIFRKKVTSYTNGGAVGELLVNCYIAPADAVGVDIEEIGVFAGNAATNSANTGVLIAHGLYTHNPKLNTESVQIQVDLTI